ncbi:MAG: hypothetical protein V1809_15070 [Planctomycetota bacterium]
MKFPTQLTSGWMIGVIGTSALAAVLVATIAPRRERIPTPPAPPRAGTDTEDRARRLRTENDRLRREIAEREEERTSPVPVTSTATEPSPVPAPVSFADISTETLLDRLDWKMIAGTAATSGETVDIMSATYAGCLKDHVAEFAELQKRLGVNDLPYLFRHPVMAARILPAILQAGGTGITEEQTQQFAETTRQYLAEKDTCAKAGLPAYEFMLARGKYIHAVTQIVGEDNYRKIVGGVTWPEGIAVVGRGIAAASAPDPSAAQSEMNAVEREIITVWQKRFNRSDMPQAVFAPAAQKLAAVVCREKMKGWEDEPGLASWEAHKAAAEELRWAMPWTEEQLKTLKSTVIYFTVVEPEKKGNP